MLLLLLAAFVLTAGVCFAKPVFALPEDSLVAAQTTSTIDLVNPAPGDGWDVDEYGNVTIISNGSYLINGHATETLHTLAVSPGLTVDLTLDNVQIAAPLEETSPHNLNRLDIGTDCTFTLSFVGDNALRGLVIQRYARSALRIGEGSSGRITSPSGGNLVCESGQAIAIESDVQVVFDSGTIIASSLTKDYAAIGGKLIASSDPPLLSNVHLSFTGTVSAECRGASYGSGIGFSCGDDSSISIGGNAHIEAYGGASMSGIGADVFGATVTISHNAYLFAQGGDSAAYAYDGPSYPDDYIQSSSFQAGAGIGSGGFAANYTGSLVIEDSAVVIAQGGKASTDTGYPPISNQYGQGGPGIGPAGLTVIFVGRFYSEPIASYRAYLRAQGLSDEEINTLYPVLQQAYFSPLTIHSLGVSATGGAGDYRVNDQGQEYTPQPGANIGTGGTILLPRPPFARVPGNPREGVYEIRYHVQDQSGAEQVVTLQYYDNGTTLPSLLWLSNFAPDLVASHYVEWSEQAGASNGLPQGASYTGSASDLYLVLNPLLPETNPAPGDTEPPSTALPPAGDRTSGWLVLTALLVSGGLLGFARLFTRHEIKRQ